MTELVPFDDQLTEVQLPPNLAAIRLAIGNALDDIKALEEAGDLDGLLIGVAVLDIIRRDLGVLRAEAGRAASGQMQEKVVALTHVGLFERKADVKRTTDWDAIISEIRKRALVDVETGEMVDDPAEAVERALALVREIVPLYRSTGAKQGGLKGAGIDKDQVQDSEWKAPNVVYKGKK